MRLAADGIRKRYGEHTVLQDCSFSLSAGECVQLKGPSGGGKSTLLRILALLESADGGTVTHGEQTWKVERIPPGESPYPFLTVVFQQLFLWPHLTMAQNISLVLHHRVDAPLSLRYMEMLERLHIATLMDRKPHECSLGERQRLALARALLSEARFLLLDEPSSALDRRNRDVLVQEISAALDEGRGVLVVTHEDTTFNEIASRTLELEDGRLRDLNAGALPAAR